MNALTRCLETYWSSSIGKKLVVAITGVVLVLFLAGHLMGNLVVFLGPEPFNAYAYFLHHMLHGVGIWLFRVVMLGMVAAHIVATIALTVQNRAARKAYECQTTIQASISSRYMIVSGLTILAFVIYHMLHFTARIGNQYNTLDRYKTTLHGVEGEVHNAWLMVIDGFSWWPATLFYVIAMTLLCSHLIARGRFDVPDARLPLQEGRQPDPADLHRLQPGHLARFHLHPARHLFRFRPLEVAH